MGITHVRFVVRAAGALAIAAIISTAAPAFAVDPGSKCGQIANVTCLGDPLTAAPTGLGSPASPEEDLAAAMDALQAADTPEKAATAKGQALAIIEGDATKLEPSDQDFLARKVYAGIPLLNTDAKAKPVAAPTPAKPIPSVDVHEVRYGDHAILDTSMLRFADMNSKFTVNWYITEVGTTFGGVFSPTPAKATAAQAPVWQPLGLPGLDMGTLLKNRFTPGGATEETRLATRMIPVTFDAPSTLGGLIMDPSLKPGAETFAQIAIANNDADPATRTPDLALPTTAQVYPAAKVRQLDADLESLDTTNLDAVHAMAANDASLVPGTASRDTLPKGDLAAPDADVNVQFANAEAYVDQRDLRVAPGGSITFSITNLDGVDRHFDVRQLRNRSKLDPTQGVLSWGQFDSNVIGTGVDVPAGETRSLAVTSGADASAFLQDSAFALWIGDPKGGSQAGWGISLDRGPRMQSLQIGNGPIKPLHEALDANNRLWVTLANTDEVAFITPNKDALSATGEPKIYALPGGINDPDPATRPDPATIAAGPVFGPGDIRIDPKGIVWVTLGVGNAIARIDPTTATTDGKHGIHIIHLKPCTEVTCRRAPVPGNPAAPLSRIPLQLRVYEDAGENTVLYFTEQAADAIGVLRVSKDDVTLNESHIYCDCIQPLGLALDPSGDVWFTEGSTNRLGRMTPNPTAPFAAKGHTFEHYNIPGAVCEAVPGQEPNGDPACQNPPGQLPPLTLPNPALTALPHSVAVDAQGRVWYTGEANERVGYLDPAKAKDGTQNGFVDAPGPKNEFGRALAPADLTIDAAGKVFFADEYGDQIASATAAGGQIRTEFAFRP